MFQNRGPLSISQFFQILDSLIKWAHHNVSTSLFFKWSSWWRCLSQRMIVLESSRVLCIVPSKNYPLHLNGLVLINRVRQWHLLLGLACILWTEMSLQILSSSVFFKIVIRKQFDFLNSSSTSVSVRRDSPHPISAISHTLLMPLMISTVNTFVNHLL